MPHHYALEVVSGGFTSNPADFIVVKKVDMTMACATPNPSSVAIADQLGNSTLTLSPIAAVTNSGCNSLSIIDINPDPANVNFGKIINTIAVGATPQCVAVSSHLGKAVGANNRARTSSISDVLKGP